MAAAIASGVIATSMAAQIPNQMPVASHRPPPLPSMTHQVNAAPENLLFVSPNSSLYVGDLDPSVMEVHLLDLFTPVAPVLAIRVCRDSNRRSLGYAYVTFSNPDDAKRAMDSLNFTPVKGRPIRIMISNHDPSTRLSGKGNVFIKNLDGSIDNKALFDTFSSFGTILSCKVATDTMGRSKGYGFVQYETEESAQAAIGRLNGMLLNDKQVFVGHFVRREERGEAVPRFTNVYVKNLPKEITDGELKKTFEKYGDISSAVVVKDEGGNSKCFGFVNFESPEAAAVAVEKMNGIILGDKALYVAKAQKKYEREDELRRKFEEERIRRSEEFEGMNLFLKNLDDRVNDETLKEMFSVYGNVTSCKVMVNSQGFSRGFGFVSFSDPEEALRAMNELNGKIVGGKPLYIALAKRKEERQANLEDMFVPLTPTGIVPGVIRVYHHPTGPMAVPMVPMYGHGLVPLLPMGYGYQLHDIPGVGPVPVPVNLMMPYHHGAMHMPPQQEIVENSEMAFVGGQGGNNMMDMNGVEVEALAPQGVESVPLDASEIPPKAPEHPEMVEEEVVGLESPEEVLKAKGAKALEILRCSAASYDDDVFPYA